MQKQLFYLTNNALTAGIWRRGSLVAGPRFENNPAGWQAFSEHVAGNRNMPALLLADLVEEDFQRDNIPHVIGQARAALIQRRLATLYQDTPYRQASPQGREKEGRKDDRMLFSALTNPALPKPWLDALLKQQVPLAGIFSVALLSPLLFRKFGPDTDHQLLVTLQSGGLRQSYFQNGYFRFSRLTPLTAQDAGAIAELARLEITKTRQFLASTRLMPRDGLINILLLTDAETSLHLQELCPDTATSAHRFMALDQAMRTLGLKNPDAASRCDTLFLSLLGSNRLRSHYALPQQTRFYALWQARTALYLFSAATLAGGLLLAGSNSLDARDASTQTGRLELETRTASAQYRRVISSMPATVAKPHDMKSAVDLEQMIAQNAPAPGMLLGIISRALQDLPQIKINQLHWQASTSDGSDGSADPANPAQQPAPGVEMPLPAILIGVPEKPLEIVTIEAEVLPFRNDYRSALESVRQFTDALGKNPHLQVAVTRPPLDIRPAVKLEGQAGNNDAALAQAQFDLKLVWKP